MSFIEIKSLTIDKETYKTIWNELNKIPTWLKKTLGIVVLIGACYLGYSKMYQYEIEEIQQELVTLKSSFSLSVNTEMYSSDIFYMISAMETLESTLYYAYQEEQLRLTLIRRFISREHPNDPLLYDIDAMMQRNEHNYKIYKEEFDNYISKCKLQIEKTDKKE